MNRERYLIVAAHYTRQMRAFGQISAARTEALRAARAQGATYAEMAEACGISEVAIYKALRGKAASARAV